MADGNGSFLKEACTVKANWLPLKNPASAVVSSGTWQVAWIVTMSPGPPAQPAGCGPTLLELHSPPAALEITIVEMFVPPEAAACFRIVVIEAARESVAPKGSVPCRPVEA